MKNYHKISTYFKENWYIVLPMCITALFFNGLMCLIPQIEGKTINSIKSGNFETVWQMVLIFIGLILFVQLNRFCKRYLVRVFGNKMSLRMKEVGLNHLIKEDMYYFLNHEVGDIINRNSSDIYDTTEGIRKMTTEVFDTIVLLLGYCISMLFLDYKITLYSMIFIICSILAAQLIKRLVYKTNKSYKEYLSKHKEKTFSTLSNELYYRGFGVSDVYQEEYDKSLEILRKKNKTALLFQSCLEPLYSIIAWLGCFFVIYFGGKNMILGVYDIGTFSALLTTYLLVAKKAAKVGKVFNAYQSFKVSWKRCKPFLEEKSVDSFSIDESNHELVLNNFSFGYEEGFQLPSISLVARLGDRIGICGRIHTGKSTILKGLSGLYPYEGSASLCGVDIDQLKNVGYERISYSSNKIELFSDTIKNNITLDREGDLNRAILQSKLDEDLAELGGLDAMISHTVANISGGQQKRLQMARALYPNVKLVLLDDPFQSVHPLMAEQMIEHLKFDDRILMLVTNQKSIISKMDLILYLEDNEIYIGRYDELLKHPTFQELMEVVQ